MDETGSGRTGLGAVLHPAGTTSDPRYVADTAMALEELGYRSLWVFDAVGRGFMMPECLTALAAAAVTTTSVELGTGVIQLAWRSMPEVAYRAWTVHQMSGGRLILGVGPGSTGTDFQAMDGDFPGRFARFADQVGELAAIFADGAANGVDLSPFAAGAPPVMIGAWRGPWVERAATNHQGWIASAGYNDDLTLAGALGRFRSAGGQRAICTNIQLGDDLDAGLERARHLAELGFDDIVVFDTAFTLERAAEIRSALID